VCGICGFANSEAALSGPQLLNFAAHMSAPMRLRGPDSSGEWADQAAGIALGHRRLAILDLSPTGHQPMPSADGRFVIVFNGEIYNFQELRKELEAVGHSFKGHSDTEVLLACFMQWGLQESLPRLAGMFAFAVWDRQERRLHLCRDRFGEKPLYYGWMGRTFLFGSELKALRAHPAWQGEVNRDVLPLYMRHGYIPAPYTIYRDVHKLLPGHLLTLSEADLHSQRLAEPQAYWSLREVVAAGQATPFKGNFSEAVSQLDTLLRRSVAGQMIADVPLGAFLSGGIDSSCVAAMMQAQSTQRVKTYTIGFREKEYNEAEQAKAVAAHLGTEHTELYVSAGDALKLVPRLPQIYDEPFADSSQLPTSLLAELTRRHVTVALSGDAGDEVFWGYDRYKLAERYWRRLACLPKFFRKSAARALALSSPLLKHLPSSPRGRKIIERLPQLPEAAADRETFYRFGISCWRDEGQGVVGASTLPHPFKAASPQMPYVSWMAYIDTLTYLPDDILVKVDRATMDVSLESRAPYLDHRVVEFAWSLPQSFKFDGRVQKKILRQVLDRYVPRRLVERPKKGFGVPIDYWLRNELREWAEALLEPTRLKNEGYFDVPLIQRRWREHIDGAWSWHNDLWNVLQFQAWLETQKTFASSR
jgi:asparagine synthase (glutamine-hydrolysing)